MNFLKGKKIGILGGIGPEATAYFYSLLIKKIQSEGIINENSDFPQIFINSIPATELFTKGDSKDKLKIYESGIEELNQHNVDLVVIACNSAHSYYTQLQRKSKAPILNMVNCVHKELKSNAEYLVLGTGAALSSRLYEFKGINTFILSPSETDNLNQIIFNFNKKGDEVEAKESIIKIIERYLAKDIQIILACTEVEILLKNTNYNRIMPLDILADSVILYFNDVKFINNPPLKGK